MSILATQNIIVAGTGSHVPEKIVRNDDITKNVNTNDEWIYQNVGVRERRCVTTETTSDLAAAAGIRAIESSGLSREEIELIIVATTTPDRLAPSTACLTKNKMEIKNKCAAFDVVAVCAGFAYAMNIAASMIAAGQYNNALLIGADVFSTITDWKRRDCVFFGDGAGAIVLQKTGDNTGGFVSKMCSNTEKTDGFTVYPEDKYFTMVGREVYEAATKALPEVISDVVSKLGRTPKDIDHIIPHQPAIRVLQKTAATLGIPFNKIHTNMDRYANTAGATIPLLMDEVNRSNVLKDGDLVVFAGIGSGWAYGATAMHWKNKV